MRTIYETTIVAGLLFFAASVSAADLDGIEFPIAELGNCGSQEECKDYCDSTTNMRQCVAFAKRNSIMKGSELEEAEKVLRALDSGATLPTGCASMATCAATCDNPKDVKTMRSCFDFAERAGLLPPEANREEAEKMFALIESGKAPFANPRDFEKCNDPESDEILEKCAAFALEMGMISAEDAEMFRKTRGKGPGGCRGKEQCDTYCSVNEEECIKFAEDNDLLSPERKEQMRQDAGRITESMKGAPAEARTCLEQALGAEKLAQMENGALRMTREIGEKIKTCFDNARPDGDFENGQYRQPGEYERPPEGSYERSSDEGANEYRPEGMFPPPESYSRPPERSFEPVEAEFRPEEPARTGDQAPVESAPTSRLNIQNDNLAAAVLSLLSGFFLQK